MVSVFVTVFLVLICSGFFYFIADEQDGPFEEAIEYVILEKTGIDVDLTPDTPESANDEVI